MGKTKIEWATDTWNPVTGCSRVSPGCDHCYAERMSRRLQRLPAYREVTARDGWTGRVNLSYPALQQPYLWAQPRRVFVCSMSDLFHPQVPFGFITRIFTVMAQCPAHTFIVLTKRPGRMVHFANVVWQREWRPWPPNVWAGTSCEMEQVGRRELLKGRLSLLAQVPAKVRFISAEPLLGSLNLRPYLYLCSGCGEEPCACTGVAFQWVIVGAESGPGARPMNLDWVRSLRDQCGAAGVPFFFKQDVQGGKRVCLPHLDGRQWREYPE